MGQVIDVATLAVRLAGAGEHELDDIVVDALRAVAHSSAADHAYLVILHDDDSFEATHEWTAPGVAPHTLALASSSTADFEYSYGFARRGEALAATDVELLPDDAEPERRALAALGVRAVLHVPIVMAGESVGLVGIDHREPVDGWSPELVDTIRSVGSLIAGALLRQRTLESLRRAVDEVAATGRQRDELLAHVSHELRTPLHAILGYAELLALETRSPRNREAVDQIVRNGQHLLALIEELLADGAHEVPAAAVRPEIDAAIAALRDTAALRRISVTPTDQTLTASIRVSPGRLRQVLYCLLTGAVHAAEDGADIVVDSPTADTVRVRLGRPRPDATAVNPLARALIEGYGRVDTRAVGDGIEIDLTFDAGGGPDVGSARPTGQGAKP